MQEMERVTVSYQAKVCLLLTVFTFFWSWQIAEPLLDRYLPTIYIGEKTNLNLPLSEVLSQYLGAGTLLSGYVLYSVVSYGELDLAMNIAFLLAAFMLASGHGVHVASVTIQNQISAQDSIHELVYFLHEYWSHNMFLIGFYSIVLLLMWTERRRAGHLRHIVASSTSIYVSPCSPSSFSSFVSNKCPTKTTLETTANNHMMTRCPCTIATMGQECYQAPSGLSQVHMCRTATPSVIETPKSHITNTVTAINHCTCYCAISSSLTDNGGSLSWPTSDPSMPVPTIMERKLQCNKQHVIVRREGNTSTVLYINTYLSRFIIMWVTQVWPVFVGVYFSVFASMTSTKPLTLLFYFGVLSSQLTLYRKFSFTRLVDFFEFYDNNYILVSGFFTKAVLVGLPLMLIDFE